MCHPTRPRKLQNRSSRNTSPSCCLLPSKKQVTNARRAIQVSESQRDEPESMLDVQFQATVGNASSTRTIHRRIDLTPMHWLNQQRPFNPKAFQNWQQQVRRHCRRRRPRRTRRKKPNSTTNGNRGLDLLSSSQFSCTYANRPIEPHLSTNLTELACLLSCPINCFFHVERNRTAYIHSHHPVHRRSM
jgi:hypothetical protein